MKNPNTRFLAVLFSQIVKVIPIGQIPQLAVCQQQRGTRECKVCAPTIASRIGRFSTLETAV